MQWSSDINCDWPTLANSVPCGLGATLTGIPYWCTDIGGYWGSNGVDWTTAANNELFTRWFQYGAFCPVFRIHGNMETARAKSCIRRHGTATTKANLLLIDKLHYRLMPYIYSLAWMTTNNNYTPMRHLILISRTDPNVKNIGNQYHVRPGLHGEPGYHSGPDVAQSVYLPAGTWYDFWTGATVTGGADDNRQCPAVANTASYTGRFDRAHGT